MDKVGKLADPKNRLHALPKRRKQLQNDLDHISQEMYRRNKELIETNKTLSILRTIDTLVLDANSTLQAVCSQISQAIAESAGYTFVGIMTRSARHQDYLTLQGWSEGLALPGRLPLTFPQTIKAHVEEGWFDKPEMSTLVSIQTAHTAESARIIGCTPTQLRRMRERLPIQSIYIVKLHARQRLVGLIVVGFNLPVDGVTADDTMFVDRLSETVGVALDNKLLFEENQHVLHQLKETNTKLKALDETKDDFISMASHQLRTPLTSVKGYISLVLEGDAGKLSPLQKQMLEQAFMSSQRMVYLIADLLNVSRLKTGKFIIDSKPVNLAQVVSEEIAQLTETAKSRDLTMEYKQPVDFPELLLDETKIRQVIMNFADNAIYYTPAGGHVKVELVDKPSSVELRIVDNGLGVPKSEQPHLFTKFYRAANARKARPDGTGLGLFMAKKVVVAQGGALIFDSTEGKGSTFGFSFAKTRLAAPEHIPVKQ
ncbi:MAG: HAMP domain-containing sensor histidine kinase [Candidatus Saccharimonadales bacterium]